MDAELSAHQLRSQGLFEHFQRNAHVLWNGRGGSGELVRLRQFCLNIHEVPRRFVQLLSKCLFAQPADALSVFVSISLSFFSAAKLFLLSDDSLQLAIPSPLNPSTSVTLSDQPFLRLSLFTILPRRTRRSISATTQIVGLVGAAVLSFLRT